MPKCRTCGEKECDLEVPEPVCNECLDKMTSILKDHGVFLFKYWEHLQGEGKRLGLQMELVGGSVYIELQDGSVPKFGSPMDVPVKDVPMWINGYAAAMLQNGKITMDEWDADDEDDDEEGGES